MLQFVTPLYRYLFVALAKLVPLVIQLQLQFPKLLTAVLNDLLETRVDDGHFGVSLKYLLFEGGHLPLEQLELCWLRADIL